MKKNEATNDAYTSWVSKGYEHFSTLGPKQISVRRIAGELKLPRTSFYYYFESQTDYLKDLKIRHRELVSDFFDELKDREIKSCTEFFRVLEHHPLVFSFQRQLFKNREDPSFNSLFLKIYNEVFDLVIFKQLKENSSEELLRKKMLLAVEVWFSRLQIEDCSLKSRFRNLQNITTTMDLDFR